MKLHEITAPTSALKIIREGLQLLIDAYGSRINYARGDERDDWEKKLSEAKEVADSVDEIIGKDPP